MPSKHRQEAAFANRFLKLLTALIRRTFECQFIIELEHSMERRVVTFNGGLESVIEESTGQMPDSVVKRAR